MSHKKNKEEAIRWLSTGQDDLETAVILRKNKKHAHACFHAQQAVEKAVKGLWYYYDADPWGHSILNDLIPQRFCSLYPVSFFCPAGIP